MCYGGGGGGGLCLTAMPRIQPAQVEEGYHVKATGSATSPMTTPDPQFCRAAWRGDWGLMREEKAKKKKKDCSVSSKVSGTRLR